MLLAIVGGVSAAWAQTNATSITDGGYYRIYGSGSQGLSYLISNGSALAGTGTNAFYTGTDNKDVWQFEVSNTSYYTIKNVATGTYINITAGDNKGGSSSLSGTSQDLVLTDNSTYWYIGANSTYSHKYLNFNKANVNVWSTDGNDNVLLYAMNKYAVTVADGLSATVTVTANNHSSAITGTTGDVYVDAAATLAESMITVRNMTAGYEFSSVSIDNENKTITVNLAEKSSLAGYYRMYFRRSNNEGYKGRTYLYYDDENSKISCTAKDALYTGSDNMEVWQLTDGGSNGTYKVKNIGKDTYMNITSGASSGTLSTGNSQDLTFHAVTNSDYSSFGSTWGWVVSNGSEDSYRYVNCNSNTTSAGIHSADAGDVFLLYPLTAYKVSVQGGDSDTEVTITAKGHSSTVTGVLGTAYVDSEVTPTIANVSVGGSYTVSKVSTSGTTINVYLAKSTYLKPSCYMYIGNGSQSTSGTTTLNLNYQGSVNCYGLLEFDITSIKTQLATGNYEVGSAFLQVTNGWNQKPTMDIFLYENDFNSLDYSTNRANVETLHSSGTPIATLTMVGPSNKKPFELYNYAATNPYDIASYQSVSTSFASTIAGLSGNTLRLAIDAKRGTNTEVCQFYTNTATSTNYGNGTTSGYAWNAETGAWESTGSSPKRYDQMLTYFGMSESQFVEAVSPKLIVVLVPKKVIINSGINPNKIETTNALKHSSSFETRTFVNASGETVVENAFAASNPWRWAYLGRFNTSTIASIKLNLAFGQINGNNNQVAGICITGNATTAEAADIETGASVDLNNIIASIYGTQTVDGHGLDNYPVSGKFGYGADYMVDFVNDAITVDEAGFKEYWKSKGEASATLSSTNPTSNITRTSKFESYAATFKTSECMDLYISNRSNGQWGRLGCSSVTIYYKDGSSASVPVTSLTAGGVTTEVTGNYTPAMIQNAYLNTDTDQHPTAATLGDVTLTAENIGAYNTLADAHVAVTAANATYTLNVSAAEAYTLTLPFAAALPTGVTAYTLNYTSGNVATATPVDALSANTPVLINAEAGNYDFTATDATIAPAAAEQGALTGVYVSQTVAAGSYVLQNNDDKLGFYKVADGKEPTIQPFRAYLSAESGASRISIVFGEESTTGVNSMNNEQCTMNNEVYDLQGRKVSSAEANFSLFTLHSSLKKGLYIVNGKKVIVK